jgi:murein DD-endopeptidase MepM/ murein hydrolase activator NlpD
MTIQGLLLAGLLFSPAQAAEPSRFEQEARRIAADLDAGRYTAPVDRFTERMRAFMPPEKAGPFFRSVADGWGKTRTVEQIRVESPRSAVLLIHCAEGTYELKLELDGRARVAGLWILPHPIEAEAPARNATILSLPFRGSWFVNWGGDTIEQNYHHAYANQKFAFDLLAVDSAGKSHTGDGKANSDYYVYGREILAPGDGTVIRVVEGVPENVPGEMDALHLVGNAVFIQHSPDETSVLAHMIPGSIRVKEGQRVHRGDIIGRCGNSGHSSEPHLHYHLQNAPLFRDGKGIKIFFTSVVVTEGGTTERKTDYSPVQKEIISPD